MRIFILEDDPQRMLLFREAFVQHDVTHAASVEEAKRLWTPVYDVVLLDHDLADVHYEAYSNGQVPVEGTGMEFVKWLCEQITDLPTVYLNQRTIYIVHSWNTVGGPNMHRALREAGLRAGRDPFGPKMIGYIKDYCDSLVSQNDNH